MTKLPKAIRKTRASDTWLSMTNLPGNVQLVIDHLYSLRNWIESGFKQAKNELGWADFR